MATRLVNIRMLPTTGALEVTDKFGATYLLQAMRRAYYDIVEMIAQKQMYSGNKEVEASEIPHFISEILQRRRSRMLRKGRDGQEYGRIGTPGSFHTNWAEKFVRPENGYWKITDAEGNEIPITEAKKLLRAVFRCRGSKANAQYWLGNITEVRILLDEAESIEQDIETAVRDTAKDWQRLIQYCERIVDSSISRLTHKYNPTLYVPRRTVEEQFKDFLKSPKNLFLILGKSGMGKTNLLCHLAGTKGLPSLFFSGDLYPIGTFRLYEELQRWLEPLEGSVFATSDFWGYVNYLSEKKQKYFVIYVDALNEFASPSVVLQELAAIVSRWGARYPALKFCISCRTQSWENLMRTVGRQIPQHNLYLPKGMSSRESTFDQIASRSTTLVDFDKRELLLALKHYGQWAKFRGKLSSQGEDLCRHPLFLKLVAQVWAGKELPDRIDRAGLWNRY